MTTYVVAPGGDDRAAGAADSPWASIQRGVNALRPGDTLFLRDGLFRINEAIQVTLEGADDAWIEIAAFPGEHPVIDAAAIDVVPIRERIRPPYPMEDGAFRIRDAEYIRVRGLKVQNSYAAGITVRDSSHVDVFNCITENTFAPGISTWDTDHQGAHTHHHRILGNTVIKANTFDMAKPAFRAMREPPHEAISIAGSVYFECAYNHVHHCEKEGIDVKETSSHGTVHHNHVHHVWRQGLYADGWFGTLEDVEFYENIVHDCRMSGIIISVEGGARLRDVRVHHNLFYDNDGTGIFFGRWGNDGPREELDIHHNTVHHNGHGAPRSGEQWHWMTGGLHLYSANIRDSHIHDNIFSDNAGFQIGYSETWASNDSDLRHALRQQGIHLKHNLLYMPRGSVQYPIQAGARGKLENIRAFDGDPVVIGDPLFVNAAAGDFGLREGSAALTDLGAIGARGKGPDVERWWEGSFPPVITVGTVGTVGTVDTVDTIG